ERRQGPATRRRPPRRVHGRLAGRARGGGQVTARPTKTGLVLGAGGVLGAAWLIGALRALEEVTGFDPRGADRLLGTSAGSILAAALGAGIDTNTLLHHQFGMVTEGAPKIDFDPDKDSGGKRPPLPKP